MDNNRKFTKLDRNLDVSEEELKTLQELERNDDGFKDEENSKYKKACIFQEWLAFFHNQNCLAH